MSAESELAARAEEPFAYLTTAGRVTGVPHTIEIWFALRGMTVYLLSGGGEDSDWVRNLITHAEVTIRIGEVAYRGRARVVEREREDVLARNLVHAKYAPRQDGDLDHWRDHALPVAIDLDRP
ncbi:MAG: nitroreductase family deazaflavin-dependent oxidoreductase [Actinobacteria bacterium]|nr:nitroreductase family deazaflavin-dependent oxidoreductase [Actinomycetota bacterium]